jgi:hypothetical protein
MMKKSSRKFEPLKESRVSWKSAGAFSQGALEFQEESRQGE